MAGRIYGLDEGAIRRLLTMLRDYESGALHGRGAHQRKRLPWRYPGGGARLVQVYTTATGMATDGELSTADFKYADAIDATDGDLDSSGVAFEAYWCAAFDAPLGAMGTLHEINGEKYVMPLNSSMSRQAASGAIALGRPHAAFKGGIPSMSAMTVDGTATTIPMADMLNNSNLVYPSGTGNYNVVEISESSGDYWFNHKFHGSHLWLFSANGSGRMQITLSGYGGLTDYPTTETVIVNTSGLADGDPWAASWSQILSVTAASEIRIKAEKSLFAADGAIFYCYLTVIPMFF
jgi:hypothetical protein